MEDVTVYHVFPAQERGGKGGGEGEREGNGIGGRRQKKRKRTRKRKRSRRRMMKTEKNMKAKNVDFCSARKTMGHLGPCDLVVVVRANAFCSVPDYEDPVA